MAEKIAKFTLTTLTGPAEMTPADLGVVVANNTEYILAAPVKGRVERIGTSYQFVLEQDSAGNKNPAQYDPQGSGETLQEAFDHFLEDLVYSYEEVITTMNDESHEASREYSFSLANVLARNP